MGSLAPGGNLAWVVGGDRTGLFPTLKFSQPSPTLELLLVGYGPEP
jgi:hypothetical protein